MTLTEKELNEEITKLKVKMGEMQNNMKTVEAKAKDKYQKDLDQFCKEQDEILQIQQAKHQK